MDHTHCRDRRRAQLLTAAAMAVALACSPTAQSDPASVLDSSGVYRLEFKRGWNFVSIPVLPALGDSGERTCAELFGTVTDTTVWRWDADAWKFVDAGAEPVRPLHPYWIHVTQDAGLEFTGYLLPAASYTAALQPGWNVLCPATDVRLPKHDWMTAAWGWDAERQEYALVRDDMRHGRAYWVYAQQPGDIALAALPENADPDDPDDGGTSPGQGDDGAAEQPPGECPLTPDASVGFSSVQRRLLGMHPTAGHRHDTDNTLEVIVLTPLIRPGSTGSTAAYGR